MSEQEAVPGFAIACVREDGKWRCTAMDSSVLGELDAAITELRKVRSTGAIIGLLGIDDPFFLLLGPAPSGPTLPPATAGICSGWSARWRTTRRCGQGVRCTSWRTSACRPPSCR